MWQSKWQVGLEIQAQQLLAVAARSHRGGWQLQRWWQQPLPPDTFCEAQLRQPQALSSALATWQAQLPPRYRLQCALPAALVLQAQLALPAAIAPAQIAWAVQLSLPKLFPLPADDLAYDFCYPTGKTAPLLITVARRSMVAAWLAALRVAQLAPSVIEVTPCLLRGLARQQQQPPQALLLQLQPESSLVVSPLSTACQFITLPTNTELFSTAHRWCVAQCGVTPTILLLSGEVALLSQQSERYPSALWRAFCHFNVPLPMLPERPERFAVACGLATLQQSEVL